MILYQFTNGESEVQRDVKKFAQGNSTGTHKRDSQPDLPNSRADFAACKPDPIERAINISLLSYG